MAKTVKKVKPDKELIEAVEAAIIKEQHAQVFYTKASGLAKTSDVKELFRELKTDEIGHERMLLSVLKELRKGKLIKKRKAVHMEPLLGPEFGIFRMKNIPRTTTSFEEALVIGMRREKDAWRDYNSMAKMAPTEELKDLFKMLAQFEAGHLTRLEKMYESKFPEGS